MSASFCFTIFIGPRLQQCRFDLFVFSLLSPRPTPDTSQIPSLSMTALACLMLLFPHIFILNVYKNEVTSYMMDTAVLADYKDVQILKSPRYSTSVSRQVDSWHIHCKL